MCATWVGFPLFFLRVSKKLYLFPFIVISFYILKPFSLLISLSLSFLRLVGNVGGMASKGLRAISCQITRNLEAGYKLSHTSETLIGYTACWQIVIYLFFLIQSVQLLGQTVQMPTYISYMHWTL